MLSEHEFIRTGYEWNSVLELFEKDQLLQLFSQLAEMLGIGGSMNSNGSKNERIMRISIPIQWLMKVREELHVCSHSMAGEGSKLRVEVLMLCNYCDFSRLSMRCRF